MVSNTTISGPNDSSTVVSIALIRPTLKSTMVSHTCLMLLVPLLFALFYYSSPHSRRQPIFALNVLTLAMAFSLGIVMDTAGIYAILSPQNPFPSALSVAIGSIIIVQSMLIDFILLMRLVVVYPLRRVGLRRFILVTSLPIFLKIARTANFILLLTIATNVFKNSTSATTGYTAFLTLPYWKIEWVAQIVDNGYASLMFLWTIRHQGPGTEYQSRSVIVKSTLAYRLRVLFRIALSNFVIPTISSVAILVISFRDIQGDYLGGVAFVNSMLSTYGVAFASVWVGMEHRQNASLNSEQWNMNKSTNDVPGVGTRNSTRALSVAVAVSTVETGTEGLDCAKEGYVVVDPEFRDEINLVPIDKR